MFEFREDPVLLAKCKGAEDIVQSCEQRTRRSRVVVVGVALQFCQHLEHRHVLEMLTAGRSLRVRGNRSSHTSATGASARRHVGSTGAAPLADKPAMRRCMAPAILRPRPLATSARGPSKEASTVSQNNSIQRA